MPSVGFKFKLRLAEFKWFNMPAQATAATNSDAAENAQAVNNAAVDKQMVTVNTIHGDAVPMCQKVVCWMHSAGMSTFSAKYEKGGIEVQYTPTKLSADCENAYLHTHGKFPDTIKIALFTEHPKSTSMVHPDNKTYVNTYRGQEPIYALLACGYVDVRALRTCMSGDAPGAEAEVQLVHNFSNTQTKLALSDATITLDGVEHTQAATWATDETLSPVFFRSYVHDTIARSQTNLMNSKVTGQAMLSVASVRPNTIGGLQQCAITMAPMMNEVFRVADMKSYLSSDYGSICPQRASHFAVHAFAVAGIQPFVSQSSQASFLTPRELGANELVQLVHSSLALPWVSNEMTPYVSDMTFKPSAATTRALLAGKTVTSIGADNFEDSEMINTFGCLPNGPSYADDCEGGTGAYMHNHACLQTVHVAALQALRDYATTRDPARLTQWAQESCHADLPQEQLLAYATQMAVLGIVAKTAVSVHALTIGAQSATPLQKMDSNFIGSEGGHSAAAARFDHAKMMAAARSVYAYANRIMAAPQNSVMPQLQLENIKTQATVVTDADHVAVYNALFSQQHIPIASAPSQGRALQNLATSNVSYQLLESTTCVSRCPLAGHLRVQRVPGSSPALAKFQASLRENGFIRLSVGEFLQLRGIELLGDLVKDPANVRTTGFVEPFESQNNLPTFYKSIYMLDEYATMQVESCPNPAANNTTNSYRVGCDASDFLFNQDSALLTVEPIGYPLMAKADAERFSEGWKRQIAESRVPGCGSSAMLQALRTFARAGPVAAHCPEDPNAGLRRVTITCSGAEGEAVWNAFNRDSKFRASLLATNDFVKDTHVFRLAKGSTVVAQTVNVDALMQFAAQNSAASGKDTTARGTADAGARA